MSGVPGQLQTLIINIQCQHVAKLIPEYTLIKRDCETIGCPALGLSLLELGTICHANVKTSKNTSLNDFSSDRLICVRTHRKLTTLVTESHRTRVGSSSKSQDYGSLLLVM